jgi:hypothetical protein
LQANANAFSARIQPHLLDGLAAPAKELDLKGSGTELLNAGRIAVNLKQAEFFADTGGGQ